MFLWSKSFVLLTLAIALGVTGTVEETEPPENTDYRPKRRKILVACRLCKMTEVSEPSQALIYRFSWVA